jgi:trehalose utilization protein
VRAAIARKEKQHVAWATERDDGGRGFGFTGGHVHWNWADPNFRKLVLNAIVWCANVDVPKDGVTDAPKTFVDLESNPDEEVPADFDREAIRKEFKLPAGNTTDSAK